MKEIFNIGNGAVVLSEEAGDFKLSVNESLSAGGGEAAGIVSLQGQASLVLKGKAAFDLGMKVLEAHSPAAIVPLEEAVQAIADSAISSQ